MRRHRMSKSSSRRNFTKHARKTHKKNLPTLSMRGGIRL